MKYETYRVFFKKQGYSFRRPRTDICDFCENMKHKISRKPTKQELKIKLELHKRQVVKYQTMKKEILEKHKNDDETMILEFDYAQNLMVPKLNVNSQYYKRNFYLYVFNIHEHTREHSALYYYLENEGFKNANSVCSMLYDFISKHMGETVKKIILFSDSSGGQNKNITVVRFLTFLSEMLNVEIRHIYPVRGHSYNQCDRNFALYTRKIKRLEKVETAADYVKIFGKCRKKPFELIHFTNFKDWSAGLKPFSFNKPKSENKGSEFKIQSYRGLWYYAGKKSEIGASATFFPTIRKFRVFKRAVGEEKIDLNAVEPPILNRNKIEDVKTLMRFVSAKNRKWFKKNLFCE